MLVRIGFEHIYDIAAPHPMLLMLLTHPSRAADLLYPERLDIDPFTPQQAFIDCFGNCAIRIDPREGKLRLFYDNIIQDPGLPEPAITGARLHPIEEVPTDCMQFLLASRYCEVDRLSQMAWDLFGKTPATYERVQAVMDWVHNRIEFGYEHASATKTAADVCDERHGVCRDFQHLAITLLRALNIPARYATGYLGDIGAPPNPTPMDFSAWLEAYLDGRWYTLDARHNTPRIGRVLMAVGRDATDVALSTSFGPDKLESFKVWTDEVDSDVLAARDTAQKKVTVTTIMPSAPLRTSPSNVS